MTTETAALAAPTVPTARQAGADLLDEVLQALSHHGYTKVAIDTWRNQDDKHNVRHAYTNGEWILTAWFDNCGAIEHRYSVRAEMPPVVHLVAAIVPSMPPF